MENFPYFLTLFIFTVVAVVAYTNYTRQKADEALESEDSGELRMAAPRNPVGKIVAPSVHEGDTKSNADA